MGGICDEEKSEGDKYLPAHTQFSHHQLQKIIFNIIWKCKAAVFSKFCMFLFSFSGRRVGKLHVYLLTTSVKPISGKDHNAMAAKKEAKKLRHLGSLRAHFHLNPIHATTTTLTSNSYRGHPWPHLYDHLWPAITTCMGHSIPRYPKTPTPL